MPLCATASTSRMPKKPSIAARLLTFSAKGTKPTTDMGFCGTRGGAVTPWGSCAARTTSAEDWQRLLLLLLLRRGAAAGATRVRALQLALVLGTAAMRLLAADRLEQQAISCGWRGARERAVVWRLWLCGGVEGSEAVVMAIVRQAAAGIEQPSALPPSRPAVTLASDRQPLLAGTQCSVHAAATPQCPGAPPPHPPPPYTLASTATTRPPSARAHPSRRRPPARAMAVLLRSFHSATTTSSLQPRRVQQAVACRPRGQQCRPRLQPPRATEGPGAEIQIAAPLSSPQGVQLAGVLRQPADVSEQLFDQFVGAYLEELKAARRMEQEMEEAAAADAAAEAAAAQAAPQAAADSGSEEASSSGQDVADTWNDAALMRRIKALREAERGQVLIDLVYLDVARLLARHGLSLTANVGLLAPAVSQPPGCFVSATKLEAGSRAGGLLSRPVLDAVLSYLASTFEGGDGELMRAASPTQTPLSIDRVQAARLYAGLVEFGYFSASLEAACVQAGIEVGQDSARLIAHADSLPEQELRQLCAVKSADAWWGAVRHIGCVFGLTPNQDPFDSFGLPFPDLSVTISQIRMEPAVNMWEHFNEPGSAARLAAKAADKAARGWSGEGPDGSQLPEADLLAFEFGLFQRLLLEGAVFGAVLFGVEQRLEQQFSYPLSSRRDREEQAQQPPP